MQVRPGEKILCSQDCLLGHGTYRDTDTENDNISLASITGKVVQIDRLITVEPKPYWYSPTVGDVVVGRVTGISNKRWEIDIKSKPEAVLMLTAINLEGNVQRRRGESDEVKMKEYYGIGDIIIAEVQSTGGSVQLSTRRYPKIVYGILISIDVWRAAEEKVRVSKHNVSGKEINVVCGANGYVVIHSSMPAAKEIKTLAYSLFPDELY